MGASRHGCTLIFMAFNPTTFVQRPNDVEANHDSYFGNGDLFGSLYNFGGDWLTSQWNNFSGITAQQELQTNAQEFQEYMYQEYNSPEALKRQFENAGLNTNLLGSTSFGTAQGSSGAPAVNAPASVASDVANAATHGASNISDVGLKGSQSEYYMSFPSLNKAMEENYGIQTAFTQKEYDFLCDTFEWRLENEEFTARTIRENYYYAVQRVENAKQEYYNLVSEGQILEHDITLHDYMAKVQKEVYDYWVQHGMPPSGDWQDKFWDDFIYNHDDKSFNRYMRGFRSMEDNRNSSVVQTGAAKGEVSIGGFKTDMATVQYCLEHGIDLFDYLKQQYENDDSWLGKVKNWLGLGQDSDSSSDVSIYTDKQIKRFNTMDDIIRSVSAAHPDWEMTDSKVVEILRDEGYSWSHIGEYLNRSRK